ncbi:TonB-dependent receptor [Neolewinella aurantiaca]|uniref:TonB-dependent receptor n=1 Tax=Neolewinella aurantiaca TaxID=2602767 RepID=A0A5C7FHX5_9BACT|nr:TonB-dependent receptor [Neolewinella aurantiaca]TXF90824.1 TonB-dependent receptor [Neolewinella aurantiaca]
MLNRILTLAVLLLVATTAFAQSGAVSGTVYDEDGFPMLGANVVIQGTTTGAQTDFIEGKFQFKADPGVYTIVASYVGYADQVVPDVEVIANETTVLDVNFSADGGGIELDMDITVKAKALERGEVAVMKIRQNDINAKDLISQQEISSLGASTAASALTKVTGTTVVDGKYVYVRGLGDRYSATTINGLRLPSIDPYRNSAQLDLIPTSILDNISASKTFTPDLPGDFTGGSVDIKIKALPERFTWGVSASAGYNGQSNLQDNFVTYDAGDGIGLGYNDGTLDRPAAVATYENSELAVFSSSAGRPARSDDELAAALDDVANDFGNGFTLNNKDSGLDYSLSANIGNQFNLGSMPVGVFATASVSQDYSQYNDGRRGNYVNPGDGGPLQEIYDVRDDKSTQAGKVGGMLGLSFKPSPSNNITLYGLYSHQGFTEGRILQGSNEDKGASGEADNFYRSQASTFLERELINYVAQGEHVLTNLGGTKIEWTANYVDSEQNEPDLRFAEYIQQGENFIIDPSQFQRPSRFFRDLSDDSYQGKLDITIPFLQKKSKANNFRFGGLYQTKERDFNENIYAYNNRSGISFSQAGGDFDVFLGPDNLGIIGGEPGSNVIGVHVFDNSNAANSYTGTFDVAGGYGMLTYEISERLKAVGGLRVEQTTILVESDVVGIERERDEPNQANIDDNTANIEETNLMPALNLIFKATESSNVRLGFSQTIARPNMREVAPFGSFGFLGEPPVFGNPDLKLTDINNFDLRYEVFPNPGEVIAFSAFYKQFTNPIVTTFRLAGEQQFTWTNSESADLYGVELEFRKSLAVLGESFQNFTFSSNFAYIQSNQEIDEREVQLGQEVDPNFSGERVFNGQSDFVANANLAFRTPETGWDAIIAYNYFSDRLQSIGAVGSPDIFEKGRSQLDISVSKQVNNFKFSLRGRNLLNPDFKTFSDFQGEEYIFSQYTRGVDLSLGVSYSL